MKYQHIKRIFDSLFYVNFKKHYCPDCHELLRKVKVSKIINSKSMEAREFDFSAVDTYMIGNVKFIWTEFHCNVCNTNITIKEMKKIEKELKNKSK